MATDNSWNALSAEASNMHTPPQRLVELARQPGLEVLVAGNPATPPELLKQLRTAYDPAIRRAIARNPNTPLSTLYTLAAEFPEEFLNNPVLPMVQMTLPHFIKDLPLNAWRSLLRFSSIPKPWLQQLERDKKFQAWHRDIWSLIQLHQIKEIPPEWRKEATSQIKGYAERLTRAEKTYKLEHTALFLLFAALFPQTAPMLKEQWVHSVSTTPYETAFALAANISISRHTLTKLSFEDDIFVLTQVARHPLTIPPILARLASHRDARVRCTVAKNPHTPLESIYPLLSEEHTAVRRAAVSHPALTAQDYEILALDQEKSVRAALATVPRLPTQVQRDLAHDPAPEVRAALARNTSMEQRLLQELTRDTEDSVRAAVAGNPRLPSTMIDALALDPAEAVRASLSGNARITPTAVARLAQDSSPLVRRYLAANPRTPTHLLEQLEISGEMEVWRGIASHPQATPEQLERLVNYGDVHVRAAVAANKHTPSYILDMLIETEEDEIVAALLSNPHTPLDVLERAIKNGDLRLCLRLLNHPVLVEQHHRPLIAQLASSLAPLIASDTLPNWVRRVVFQWASSLPSTLLEPFAASPYWEDRYLVARHVRSSPALLNKLAQDGIVYVRAMANERLSQRKR